MLKAMYRLKGYEGMLADFQEAAFIFDEIHAYEANRLALIVESMRYLRERHGASFFIMSATFPSLIRERLLAALKMTCMIQADDALYQDFCRHTLNVLEGDLFDSHNWRRVIKQAQAGKSVLVCCNTVGRAQAAQQQRFGRINRRRLMRPTAAVHVFTQPIVDKRPYQATLVDAAVRILRREHGRPIQEDHTGNWLDEIYIGDIAREWQSKYERSAREFRESCLTTLRPFQSDQKIEDIFYKAFDGVEVLPACLADEYETQKEKDPILAQELLVPIRYGQLQQIRSAGRLQSTTHPIIVDVPYEGGAEGIGLDLSALRR
jgi:CRISPR/Cas system-associated endonuclease/helicase Cas3